MQRQHDACIFQLQGNSLFHRKSSFFFNTYLTLNILSLLLNGKQNSLEWQNRPTSMCKQRTKCRPWNKFLKSIVLEIIKILEENLVSSMYLEMKNN